MVRSQVEQDVQRSGGQSLMPKNQGLSIHDTQLLYLADQQQGSVLKVQRNSDYKDLRTNVQARTRHCTSGKKLKTRRLS